LKLGKTAWAFLAIGLFVFVVAGLILAYYEHDREQIRLQQELSSTQEILAKYTPKELSSRQEEAENQLARAESELEAAKANLRQSIESIEATDTIFAAARASNVEVLRVRSLGTPTAKGLEEGLTLTFLSLSVKVEGDIPNLVNFVVELNGKFPSGAIESVEIIVPEAVEGEEEEELRPSADIQLSIHTYEGD